MSGIFTSLDVNIHLFCNDAGAASSRKCVQLPNNFILLFVLKNTNPDSIFHKAISNEISPAYLKNRLITIALLVSKKSGKLVE